MEENTLPLRAPAVKVLGLEFLETAPKVSFQPGRIIAREGENCNSLYFLLSGQVLVRRRQPEASVRALYFLSEGDVFGEDALTPERCWSVTTQALTSGRVCLVAVSLIPRLTQLYPQLTTHLFSLLAQRLHWAHHCLEWQIGVSAHERVLALLRSLAAATGEPREQEVWLPLHVTRSEMGEMVGMSRETVTRVLTDLEADGKIRRAGRAGLWLRSI